MSLVFDKGKFRYYKELDQNKSKINNSHVNLSKNNPKKNNLNNNPLFNDYETSSPFRNINNNKKNTFLTTYQNYSNITNSHRDQNHNNKKGINSKKLKYNKSFEGNLMNNDLIFSNNFDLANDDISMLEDMIVLALNDAFSKVYATLEKKMGKYSSMMNGLM